MAQRVPMAVVAAKGCKCGSFSGGQRLGGVHLPAVPAGGDDGRRAQEIKRRRYDLREQDGRAARPAAAGKNLPSSQQQTINIICENVPL